MCRLFYLASFVLLLHAPELVQSIKRIGEACHPEKNECGQNAICEVPKPCSLGFCTCLSSKFRSTFDGQHLTPTVDCLPLLKIGDNCTLDNSYLVDREHGHICSFGVVVCLPNFEIFGNHCIPKMHVGSYGNECNSTQMCNPLIGLTCEFLPRDEQVKVCKCPRGMTVFEDKSLQFSLGCKYPELEQKCDNGLKCLGDGSGAVCKNDQCECDNHHVTVSIATINVPTGVTVKESCVNETIAIKAGPGENCTLFSSRKTSGSMVKICPNDYACLQCPEFNPGSFYWENDEGKCFTTDAINGSSWNWKSASGSFLGFLLVFALQFHFLYVSILE